jgi:hypothetical protein
MTDPMDVEKVHETLGEAIDKQTESLLSMAVLAGSMRGVGGAAVKDQMRKFVLAELEDTYRLIEKLSALGGRVRLSATSIETSSDPAVALEELLEHETAAVKALHAVIPHSGQEPRSEALEHLLEHTIMRKQQQIDFLWHASEMTAPLTTA